MFQSERFIEDYICEHQEEFIKTLKYHLYGEEDDIKFVGRQVRVGEENIIDLLYYYDEDPHIENSFKETRYYIVVELKNKTLEAKDVAQIGRYMGVLEEKLAVHNKKKFKICCKGVLAGTGISTDVNAMFNDQLGWTKNIDMMILSPKIHYSFECGTYYDGEYLDMVKLDNRILETLEEVNHGSTKAQ